MHQSINHIIIKKYKKINFLITFLANSINPESYDQYKSLEKVGVKTNSLFKESCGIYTDGHHWHGQKRNQVPGTRENLEINTWTDNPTSTEEMLPRAIGGRVSGKEGTTSTLFPKPWCDPDTSTGSLRVKAGLGSGPWEKAFAAFTLPCAPDGIYGCHISWIRQKLASTFPATFVYNNN